MDSGMAVFLALVATFIGLALYFLPWLVARGRRHRNEVAIFALNFLAGWTVAGWIAALVWSLTDNVRRPDGRGARDYPPA